MQALITPVTPSLPRNASIARARADDRHIAAPSALKLLALAILLPDEVGLHIQGLWLSPARVVLLALTPVLLTRFVGMVASGRYRFVLSDLFIPLTALWMFVAFANTGGVAEALNHAGPIALELCVGYLATRVLLAEHGQAIAFINFLCWGIAVVALLGLLDTLTGGFFIHHLAWSLFGGKIIGESGGRVGLLRATSTLAHPILYGLTCSVGLLLAVSMPLRARGWAIFACGLGTFLSLSSAPIMAAFFGFGLLMYYRITAGIRLRWAGLIGVVAAGVMAVFIFVNNPLGFIFSHLVFDTETAYFRMWIWHQGVAALAQLPWFGLGFVFPEVYQIPFTVDSVWLLWALQFGIPASVLLALSIIGAASLPTDGPRVRLTTTESKLGTSLGILIFLIVFLGFTVDFFGTAWILIPLLVGVRAHLGELGGVRARA